MSERISLKEAEQKAFATTFEDGLWDVLIGSVVLMFAIAPFLSRYLGDFWSSAVFVPVWGLVYVAVRLARKHVVVPRIGVVKFGPARVKKMLRFNIVSVCVLTAGLVLGVVSSMDLGVPGWMHAARFGLVILASFSLAAFYLKVSRLYLYGVLIALSPLAGEWLYQRLGVPHHGYPVAFGLTAGIIMLTGIFKFVRLVRTNPVPAEGAPSEDV
jgi:hypothetical protein